LHPVLTTVLKRVGLGIITLVVVSAIIFSSVSLLPGDFGESVLGQAATEDTVAAFRKELGLDEPAVTRYFKWLGAALKGDFGTSFSGRSASGVDRSRSVASLVGPRLKNTLFLAGIAALVAVPSSLWSFFPSLANIDAGTPLLEKIYRITLPALTLTLVIVAHMMRMTRAAIINLLSSTYIEMARLKGASRSEIILKHALPNAWAPIATVVAFNLAFLVVGVVVVEVVFVYPGVGQLMVDAVTTRDIPVVQACALLFAATYIVLNLIADIIGIVSNPRLLHPR